MADAGHPPADDLILLLISNPCRAFQRGERSEPVYSVGSATEDFSALRYLRQKLSGLPLYEKLDLVADPDEPRDLFGMLLRAGLQAA